MSLSSRWLRVLLGLLIGLLTGSALAADLTLPVAGRVSIELIGSDATFRNTLSVVSPSVAAAISGCRLEPADGLGGTHVVSEKLSQRGCRVELDADPVAAGIQGFAANSVLRFGLCAQTDADAQCEFVWSSEPAVNSDLRDHVRTTNVSSQAFRLNWEDGDGLGDQDFNDLIVVVRVNADADGDGLWDDWEQSGIDTDGDGIVDLDLPALGANWQHKDIFVEIDWMDCAAAGADCAAGDTHSHRPSQAAIDAAIQAFANANVTNPDGVNGISLHIDVSNSIPHQNVLNINGLCFNGGAGIGSFDVVKADPANFGPTNPRRFAYRYGLFTHRQAANSTASGCAELPGNDFQVSLGGWNAGAGDSDGDGVADQDVGTVAQQAGTLMHELGHNLNLQHGGGESINRKPNYLSAMNYVFQMSGIPPADPDGTGPLQGRVDYSRAALPALTETALNEPAGIGDGTDNTFFRCPNFGQGSGAGSAAIDWDCDVPADATESNVSNDLNGDRICVSAGPNGVRNTSPGGDDLVLGTAIADGPDRTCDTAAAGDDVQVRAVGAVQVALLAGYDDWGNIKYDFQATGSFEDGAHLAVGDVQEVTYEEFLRLDAADLVIAKVANVPVPNPLLTGSDVVYSITVENKGAGQARNVVVTDALPAETTFKSCAATGGGVCGGSGNNRTVAFPAVPGGESATVTLVANANCPVPDATVISNTAIVATPSPEQNTGNNSATAAITASNPPPLIGPLTASPNRLWPPNHKMVDVAVNYSVTDNCGPVVCQLGVTSNEPVNGNGDGNTSPDWLVIDEHRVQLRAERAGGGTGRIYTVTATCTDSSNASSSRSTAVVVPHDNSGSNGALGPGVEPVLYSAVLPASRAARVSSPVTVFATMINAGSFIGTGCSIGLASNVPAALSYQTTNPLNNAPTGSPNTPVDIDPGASQSFIVTLTPAAPLHPADIQLNFSCTNANPAGVLTGINTLLLSAWTTPTPDVVALAATTTGDGIANIPGTSGTGFFAVATSNVGSAGSVTVTADTGAAQQPVNLALCQTNPSTGICLQPPAASVLVSSASGQTSTFAVFVRATGRTVPFNPASNRVFVRFRNAANGAVVGATSVAVRTQ